jgi:hypothetical protein
MILKMEYGDACRGRTGRVLLVAFWARRSFTESIGSIEVRWWWQATVYKSLTT